MGERSLCSSAIRQTGFQLVPKGLGMLADASIGEPRAGAAHMAPGAHPQLEVAAGLVGPAPGQVAVLASQFDDPDTAGPSPSSLPLRSVGHPERLRLRGRQRRHVGGWRPEALLLRPPPDLQHGAAEHVRRVAPPVRNVGDLHHVHGSVAPCEPEPPRTVLRRPMDRRETRGPPDHGTTERDPTGRCPRSQDRPQTLPRGPSSPG